MGFGFLCSMLVLSLLVKHLACQQPNTDGFFVSEFIKNMDVDSSSQAYDFSAPFCSWQGVVCDPNEEFVVELMASGLGLSGSVPDNSIGKLEKLQTLDLSNNKIASLPSDFWSLGSLRTLNLSWNEISGSLPSNIGNFGSIEMIDLSNNNFSGEIPAAISSIATLRVLKLNNNGFAWSIPPGIINCQSLVSIDLSSNRIDGSLPDNFGAAFRKLKALNLAANKLHGSVADFSGLDSITSLNISGNVFQGSLTGFRLDGLEVLDLSRNQFQGSIPRVWSGLVYLDLSENLLTGDDIFHNLDSAEKLRHLNLAFNRFTRQEFPRIRKLSALEYLNLSGISLTGYIPDEISQLSDLNSLDLSSNNLIGPVPNLSLKNLRVLDVSRNNLSGMIPLPVLDKLSSMDRFNFSYNNLTFCASNFAPETVQKSFFGSTNSCPIAANPSLFKKRDSKKKGVKLVLALTLSMTCLLAGMLLFLAFGCRRKSEILATKNLLYQEEQSISGPFSFQTDSSAWAADVKQANSVPVVIFGKPLLSVTFSDLLDATSNFDRGTLLAEGKFGIIYQGLLPGGANIAVKVLVYGSTLTEEEAARELEYLGRIRHPNLVPLIGYCLAGDQRIVIYEYMENGNLQNLLENKFLGPQATDSDCSFMTWRFRHKIALGIARALAFLHHGCSPPIVHRDLKASSVYLDLNFVPRLCDSGLLKLFGNSLEFESSCGSTGNTPPEFEQLQYESPTPKFDVFCFGVILFELITGKIPITSDYPCEKDGNLVSWVRGLVRTNQGSRAIDPKIHDAGLEDQIVEALRIGYLCTAELPSKRPSMQQIVGLLKDIEPK